MAQARIRRHRRPEAMTTRRKPGVAEKKIQLMKARKTIGELPVPIVTREGKTTVRQLPGRRLGRLGEVRCKRLVWVEICAGGPDGHSVAVRFQDQTGLVLDITPGFAVRPEYFSVGKGEFRSLRRWPVIRSER